MIKIITACFASPNRFLKIQEKVLLEKSLIFFLCTCKAIQILDMSHILSDVNVLDSAAQLVIMTQQTSNIRASKVLHRLVAS